MNTLSDDHIYFGCVVLGAIALALLAALITISFAGASSDTILTPGRIMAASCAESAVMPVINWTAKGALQIVQLHQAGNCRLTGEWNASRPGLYCTGIGELAGSDWIPEECLTVTAQPAPRLRFRNVFRYRYP